MYQQNKNLFTQAQVCMHKYMHTQECVYAMDKVRNTPFGDKYAQ